MYFPIKYTVVVVVNILFQTKKDTLMIGHCTALTVIATKTLAGKIELNKAKMESLPVTPRSGVEKSEIYY